MVDIVSNLAANYLCSTFFWSILFYRNFIQVNYLFTIQMWIYMTDLISILTKGCSRCSHLL